MDVRTTRYVFTLPDGPRNIEGLMVHPTTGRLSFVTRQASTAQVYVAPATLTTKKSNPLTAAGQLPVGGVTAAAWAPDGSGFALGTTTQAYVFASMDAAPAVVDLPVTLPPSGALSYDRTGARLLLSHDGASPKVLRAPVPDPKAPPANEAPKADFTVVGRRPLGEPRLLGLQRPRRQHRLPRLELRRRHVRHRRDPVRRTTTRPAPTP